MDPLDFARPDPNDPDYVFFTAPGCEPVRLHINIARMCGIALTTAALDAQRLKLEEVTKSRNAYKSLAHRPSAAKRRGKSSPPNGR
jgi:hypothetical protein